MICEVQQSSNSTYRLYDYDRRDKYGNPRELHLEKALEVLDCKKYETQEFEKDESAKGTVLGRCKYFETVVYEVQDRLGLLVDDSRFLSVICIGGHGEISCCGKTEALKCGDSVFVKARNNELTFAGQMKLIISHI